MATPDADILNWIYDTVLQVIKSPEFRNPLKDFIDDNCGSFIGLDENTFEQGELHKEFISLADNLLETMTHELDITEEMFCMAAKKGLEDSKENRKYFEQLIAFNNYTYFKNLMTKRNLHLEKLAYEAMMKDKEKEIPPENKDNNEELKKLIEEQNLAEKGELEAAIKMSLAVEEEAKEALKQASKIKGAIESDELINKTQNNIMKYIQSQLIPNPNNPNLNSPSPNPKSRKK